MCQQNDRARLASLSRDEEGFLLDPEGWTPEIALALAAEVQQPLSGEHWQVIRFIREEYERSQRVPEARSVLRFMRNNWGPDHATRRYLYQLFPFGYGQSACKIAGMRKPLKLMLDV